MWRAMLVALGLVTAMVLMSGCDQDVLIAKQPTTTTAYHVDVLAAD